MDSNFNLIQNIHTDPNSPSGRIEFTKLAATTSRFNRIPDSQKRELISHLEWLSKNYPESARAHLLIENNKLATEVCESYKDKYSLLGKRVLLQLPEKGSSRSLMQHWSEVLNHMGIQTRLLSPDKDTREQFNEFDPDVFIAFDERSSLDQLDSDTLNEWRKYYGMKLGFVLSSNSSTGLGDFEITFHRNPERHEKLSNSKLPLISLPFAANPLKHYMRPGRAVWDYFYSGQNSKVKKRETDNYLTPILDQFEGIIAGEGWIHGLTELTQDEELLFYSFARICPNYHFTSQIEEYNEVNEQTFIIPACGGFQLVDNPMAIKECFETDEMCVTLSPYEFCNKFEYYLENEDERIEYVRKGMRRVFREHTLFHVMSRFAEFLNQLSTSSRTAETVPSLVSYK